MVEAKHQIRSEEQQPIPEDYKIYQGVYKTENRELPALFLQKNDAGGFELAEGEIGDGTVMQGSNRKEEEKRCSRGFVNDADANCVLRCGRSIQRGHDLKEAGYRSGYSWS